MPKKLSLLLILSALLYALEVNYSTFEAKFVQSIQNSSGKKIVYSGRIVAKKPDMALWEYQKPIKKSVYIKGDTVIVYEPMLSQAKYIKKSSSISLDSLLKKAKQIGKNEYIAKDGQIEYKFSISDGMIESISYVDTLDNSSRIEFFERKKDIIAPDSLFEFRPPDGTDIIK